MGTDAQAPFVGVGSGHAPPGSPVTVFVSLPGAAAPMEAYISSNATQKGFFAEIRQDADFQPSLTNLNIAKLEVRVLWKAERGAPSAELALAAPAVVSEMPLLQQVHEVGADGSVCATPVAWSSLAQRGGYFYVHVRDTSVPGTRLFPFVMTGCVPRTLHDECLVC
ncbi:MAG: hypothetical protein EOO65_01420 [Methanosarcinales archaeon]|nr:MAG: hypothetical protein EOO65_01420 [Methanosarcinales archaeon]